MTSTNQESYLVFGLRGGLYALQLNLVQQIVRLKAKNFTRKGIIRGETFYKGQTIPLMDLCFLFREHNLLSVGEGIILSPPKACLIVENVLDVWENLNPVQRLQKDPDKLEYFIGTISMNKNIVLVLDIPRILEEIPEDQNHE